MNYTLHQLKIFLKVVECESVTKASEELFMTQPAVSIQLKNFQDQFDIPLIEIVKRKVFVTDFGREVASIAERILNEVEAINFKTQAYKGVLAGKLRISSASTGKYVIPYFLNEFMDQHSEIDLVLDVTNKTRVLNSLVNNEIDFAMVSVLPDEIEVEEEIIMDNKLYLVGSGSENDRSLPLIFREPGSATRAAMEEYFFKQKKERKRIELTSNEAVKQAVIAGLGQSIVPLIGLRNELTNGDLQIIPSKGLPIITQWRLIWLKGKRLSPVANAFLEFMRKNKENLKERKFGWYRHFDL